MCTRRYQVQPARGLSRGSLLVAILLSCFSNVACYPFTLFHKLVRTERNEAFRKPVITSPEYIKRCRRRAAPSREPPGRWETSASLPSLSLFLFVSFLSLALFHSSPRSRFARGLCPVYQCSLLLVFSVFDLPALSLFRTLWFTPAAPARVHTRPVRRSSEFLNGPAATYFLTKVCISTTFSRASHTRIMRWS